MKPHIRFLAALLIAAVAVTLPLIIIHNVRADAAPPPQAAASGITPGQETQVQMISETVVLDVRSELIPNNDYPFTVTVALVTADFRMRNLGSETETMDVRFPMAWPTRQAGVPYPMLQDVEVRVNGQQVITRQADFDGQPWTVWPVTFPSGQDVQMTVKYRNAPVTAWSNAFLNFFSFVKLAGNDSLAELYYILETGAGWRGPIGHGDIIFRFPDSTSLEMIEQGDFGSVYTATTPSFVAEGHDLRWHFENLEPSGSDNVRLSVITPPIWQAILDARRRVQLNPDDAHSQIRLGEAYWAAIPIKNTWPEEMSLAQHFGPLAEAAFKRAVELAPDDVLAHVSYARFLTYHAWSESPEPYYNRALQEVNHILKIDPGNAEAKSLATFLHDSIYTYLLITPTSLPSSAPDAIPTAIITDAHQTISASAPATPMPTSATRMPPTDVIRTDTLVWLAGAIIVLALAVAYSKLKK